MDPCGLIHGYHMDPWSSHELTCRMPVGDRQAMPEPHGDAKAPAKAIGWLRLTFLAVLRSASLTFSTV